MQVISGAGYLNLIGKQLGGNYKKVTGELHEGSLVRGAGLSLPKRAIPSSNIFRTADGSCGSRYLYQPNYYFSTRVSLALEFTAFDELEQIHNRLRTNEPP